MSSSFTSGARGYLGGGDTARGVVVAHRTDALHLPPILLAQALLRTRTEAGGAGSLGVPYTGVPPAVEPPLRRRGDDSLAAWPRTGALRPLEGL